MARPKKTVENTDLPNGWQNEILSLYEQGASDVEIRAYLYKNCGSFSQALWDRWIEEEQEFSITIKKGRELSQSWWEQQGRIALRDRTFSPVLWYMNMKNRFGWRDTENKDNGLTEAELNRLRQIANTEANNNM